MAQVPGPPNLTRAELMIREAEASKARLLMTPGKQPSGTDGLPLNFLHSAYVDEEYLVMG